MGEYTTKERIKQIQIRKQLTERNFIHHTYGICRSSKFNSRHLFMEDLYMQNN